MPIRENSKRRKRRKSKASAKVARAERAGIRDAAFAPIRRTFFDKFAGDLDAAKEHVSPIIDETTLGRLMNIGLAHPFEDSTIRKVEWFVNGGPERLAYGLFLDRMNLKSSGTDSLVEQWCGSYRYARHYSPTHEVDNYRYNNCEGCLEITSEDGILKFFHRSSNAKGPTGTWEHTGFVWKSDQQVFFLGTANGVMRLAIAQAVKNPSSEHILGVLVSMRGSSPYAPFAARFVMVKNEKENQDLIHRLSHPVTGPQEFLNLTAQKIYYMA